MTRDETWGCFALFFNGMQAAVATEPPPALSPSYLSWMDPARLYGKVQYLTESADGPVIIDLQACSYRVMKRARQAPLRRIAGADWEMLREWAGNLQGIDPERADDLIKSLKATIKPLNPGWARDTATANRVRATVEEVCRTVSGVDHRILYKWVRLFLG